MFLKSIDEKVQHLVEQLAEAHEDRKILAKQLRDERVLSSTLITLQHKLITLQDKLIERVTELEYSLWEVSSPETQGIPKAYAAEDHAAEDYDEEDYDDEDYYCDIIDQIEFDTSIGVH